MTIELERIQDGDWAAVNRVVDQLRSLVLDTGGRSLGVRVGTVALTFTASSSSASVAVSHGVGRTPTFVAGQEIATSSLLFGVSTVGATTFTAFAFSPTGAITGTISFYWVAIG